MRTDDFHYFLPPELIAQYPLPERAASRLLWLDGGTGELHDRHFADLPTYLNAGDVVVFNNTKVIKARLKGRKASGGQVEVLVERVLDGERALAHIGANKPPQAGGKLLLEDEVPVTVLERRGELYELRFDTPLTLLELLERYGSIPLPPYISRAADAHDAARYQTVFAKEPGAVAAPTAGLHFDHAMLAQLERMDVRTAYVTLHVGAGTFQPVRSVNIADHVMHAEWYQVPRETVDMIAVAKRSGAKVTAVGTTTLRALEGCANNGKPQAGYGETNLFIIPGYRFQVVERLLTNFHLPKSTLLMLVSAFGGIENVQRAYAFAVKERYRFFSYGDAMLIERRDG
jgi:S-adenosylmethionine:tRNA ribosyltransferase-isomerase